MWIFHFFFYTKIWLQPKYWGIIENLYTNRLTKCRILNGHSFFTIFKSILLKSTKFPFICHITRLWVYQGFRDMMDFIKKWFWKNTDFSNLFTVNSWIESRTLFRISCFGPGLYSNQDSIQVRTLLNFWKKKIIYFIRKLMNCSDF